jgi:hypothetical protein
MIESDVEHELKTSLDGFVENSGGDHDQDLDTYDPRWQERFASLSQLFNIHWALNAPREQLDGLVCRGVVQDAGRVRRLHEGQGHRARFIHGLLMPRARISLT